LNRAVECDDARAGASGAGSTSREVGMSSAGRRWAVVVAAVALVAGLSGAVAPVANGESGKGVTVSAPVARKALSHKSPKTVDISTPYYNGYNKKLKAYKFTVYGRWNPKCGDKYCWPGPCAGNCKTLNIGSNDAVRIRFSDSVRFKRMAIATYGVCGTKYYSKARSGASGSFEDAYAGVNDEVVTSWRLTKANGHVVIDDGYCKRSNLPTTGGAAAGGGGSGSYTYWGDLKGRAFRYDVWVNPLPSRGRCYDRLYVKAGYTHTWTDQSLTWSLGYPWGVGVGTTATNGSYTTWQNLDGYKDPQLKTPRMCKH
jgi:hypothetical protein